MCKIKIHSNPAPTNQKPGVRSGDRREHPVCIFALCMLIFLIAKHKDTAIKVKVDVVEKLGAETLLYCSLDHDASDVNEDGSVKSIADDTTSLIARVDSRSATTRGQVLNLAVDIKHIHMFDKETETTMLEYLPE